MEVVVRQTMYGVRGLTCGACLAVALGDGGREVLGSDGVTGGVR